jgi:exo-beta-1,3-glucanase (GH17 family)
MSDYLTTQTTVGQLPDPSRGNAICYSGYREGQDPRRGVFPTYAEIREDLLILARNWSFIRLYDCSKHAETVLEVISDERLDLQVMLGADLAAEMSNPDCPWEAHFDEDTLHANRRANSKQIDRLIALANQYPDVIFALSAGNEAAVEWSDHLVSVESLTAYVRRIRKAVSQPVTFCDNYVPWLTKLAPLAAELDFISVHTYPQWEYRTIEEALEYSKQNYHAVANRYPDKRVIITEAGWTTASNGRGINPDNASEELQADYYHQLIAWTQAENILTFVFEAFDEPWKGSPDPLEPEKHWGLFFVDRTPKLVLQRIICKNAMEP